MVGDAVFIQFVRKGIANDVRHERRQDDDLTRRGIVINQAADFTGRPVDHRRKITGIIGGCHDRPGGIGFWSGRLQQWRTHQVGDDSTDTRLQSLNIIRTD